MRHEDRNIGSGHRADVPGVVLPVSTDQFFWGRWIQALGVGPEPAPFKKLTMDILHAALNKALEDPALCAQARGAWESTANGRWCGACC